MLEVRERNIKLYTVIWLIFEYNFMKKFSKHSMKACIVLLARSSSCKYSSLYPLVTINCDQRKNSLVICFVSIFQISNNIPESCYTRSTLHCIAGYIKQLEVLISSVNKALQFNTMHLKLAWCTF
jgi:hypothetical protein